MSCSADEATTRRPGGGGWWRRSRGKHTPGVWVLYFSLAALPLFGIGQHWVPAADVGRRRYVFSLLLVYVASALALLVTTSFLGLRRYLRQRRSGDAGPDGGQLGRDRRGVDRDRDVARGAHPPAGRRVRDLAGAVASDVARQSIISRFAAGQDGSQEADASGQAIKEDAPQGDAVQEDAAGDPAESDRGQTIRRERRRRRTGRRIRRENSPAKIPQPIPLRKRARTATSHRTRRRTKPANNVQADRIHHVTTKTRRQAAPHVRRSPSTQRRRKSRLSCRRYRRLRSLDWLAS